MERLKLMDLHRLRVLISANAESLEREATLLLEHGHFARAYLLAHLAVEELGKLPIVVGVIGQQHAAQPVDWRNANRRFRDHRKKVQSDDVHHYMFALDPDALGNEDVAWLEEARAAVLDRVRRKNDATYVDVVDSELRTPLESITRDEAEGMLSRVRESLLAHRETEALTNPIVREANASQARKGKDGV